MEKYYATKRVTGEQHSRAKYCERIFRRCCGTLDDMSKKTPIVVATPRFMSLAWAFHEAIGRLKFLHWSPHEIVQCSLYSSYIVAQVEYDLNIIWEYVEDQSITHFFCFFWSHKHYTDVVSVKPTYLSIVVEFSVRVIRGQSAILWGGYLQWHLSSHIEADVIFPLGIYIYSKCLPISLLREIKLAQISSGVSPNSTTRTQGICYRGPSSGD